MARIISIRTAGLPSTLTGLSRARSPQTSQSSGLPRSSFSSTLGPPRCLGLDYPCLSSFAPTTRSSKSLQSTPLRVLRCMSPPLAHRDEQERLEFSVAIGGAADMDRRAAQPETDANDPLQTSADPFCCDAQR